MENTLKMFLGPKQIFTLQNTVIVFQNSSHKLFFKIIFQV